jgi:hypothetical protein
MVSTSILHYIYVCSPFYHPASRALKDIGRPRAIITTVRSLRLRGKGVQSRNAKSAGSCGSRRESIPNVFVIWRMDWALIPALQSSHLERKVRALTLQMHMLLPDGSALAAGRFVPTTPSLPNGISDAVLSYGSGSVSIHSKQRGW